jgi:ribose transport system substrate-binding protein
LTTGWTPKPCKKRAWQGFRLSAWTTTPGAYKAGRFLAEGVNKPTKAAILEGIRSADNARQRMEGAKRALLENPHIKLVATETANWKTDEARKVTEAIFSKKGNADIKLLFAANDMMAFGAIEYLKSNPKLGASSGGLRRPAAGPGRNQGLAPWLATVDQQAAEQGYQGVALALRLLKNETVPAVT